MRRILLYLIICMPLPSIGQTLTGRVADSEGRPLVSVSVVAIDSDKSVVTFTRTGESGLFSLTIPQNVAIMAIEFGMLGMERQVISFDKFKNSQTVIMKPEAFTLKEVEVRPRRIRNKADTLTYSVAAFLQQQDRSIADVIAKMPGLEVKTDGTIEYMGKPINRFYIEGMDLLGGRYAQASENLQANMIKSVQVIENHQPVKVLKDINFSEQAALNLVLKDNAKQIWQGMADLAVGYGNGWLRSGRIIGMMFGRNLQSISMYKTDDTGKDIEHEVADLVDFDATAPTERSIVNNIATMTPGLDRKRSLFNDTHLTATNWLFRTKHGNDIRVQLTGLYDNSEQRQNSQTSYLDADSAVITELQDATSRRSEWGGTVLYRSNHDNYYFSNTLTGYIDFNRSSGISILNGTPTPQQVKLRKRYVIDNTELIKKLDDKHSISVTSLFSYSTLPTSLLVTNDSCQNLRQSMLFWDVSAFFQHKISSVTLTYKTGYHLQSQQMKTTLCDKYTEMLPYVEPQLSFRGNEWNINLKLPARWIYRHYGNLYDSQLLLTPRIFARYNLTSSLNISGTYNYNWSPSPLQVISILPVFVNRTIRRQGSGCLEHETGHYASLRLSYRHMSSGIFGTVSTSFQQMGNGTIYRSRMVGNTYQQVATGYRQNHENYTLYANIGQSLYWASLRMTISGHYSWGRYRLLRNNRLDLLHQQNALLTWQCSARPAMWLSIEERSEYTFQHRTLIKPLHAFTHHLRLYFFAGKWQMECSGELYHSNDEGISTYLNCDLSASYRTKLFEAGLACTNLMGTNHVTRHYTTDNSYAVFSTPLRPRELLVRLLFNF